MLICRAGTGKTLVTIAIAGTLFLDGKVSRMLIVCPKSIVGVWESEFQKFADYRYSLAILEGTGTEKVDTLNRMKGGGLQVAVADFSKYIMRLLSKGKKSNSVVTKFTLKKAQNTSGITYSQAVCDVDRNLTEAEQAAIDSISEQVKRFAGKVNPEGSED